MAKFIKSIFHTTERRKSRYEEPGEDQNNTQPPMDVRRKLSISRSGRMKQANKKRHSLSLELYNQELEMNEKRSGKDNTSNTNKQTIPDPTIRKNTPRGNSAEIVTPEEEIESAFSIIDQT